MTKEILTIANDDELLAVIREYLTWNEENMPPPLDSLNGLRNIMLFIRDHLIDKVSLCEGLRHRFFDQLNEGCLLVDENVNNDPRLNYALKYIFITPQKEWGNLDNDLKYWFMSAYVDRKFRKLIDEDEELFDETYPGLYSITEHFISKCLRKKSAVYFQYFEDREEFLVDWFKELGRSTHRLPVETHMLLEQIDVYYYIRQQLAFGDGVDLVERIEPYFIAPEVQGQLGSLLPAAGKPRVDLEDVRWFHTEAGRKYIDLIAETEYFEDADNVWDFFVNL